MATTKISDLINPIVLGQYLDVKMIDAIKLTPLMEVNRELQAHYGDTLQMQKYTYIGDAEALGEGEEMIPTKIGAETVSVKVGKVAKAVELTDEAIMNHYGDVVNEVGRQLLMSIASKIEDDCFKELRKATVVHNYSTFGKDVIADAQVKFGEDINEPQYLLINAEDYAVLRKDADFVVIGGGERVISGHVGRIFGVDVIVSNRVQSGEAFIMKHGALMLLIKENCQCEADRDILKMTNVFTAHEFFVPFLKYDDRVIKLAKN